MMHSTREASESELTSFLSAVLTGFDTVSFHSVGFEVYFDAVSTKCNVQACALADCTVCDLNKWFCLHYRDCLYTSLGVSGRCGIRTHDVRRFWSMSAMRLVLIFCLRPLGQPSCFVLLSLEKTSEPHGWLVVNTIIKPKLIWKDFFRGRCLVITLNWCLTLNA